MQLAKVVVASALMQDVQKGFLKVNAPVKMYSRCGYFKLISLLISLAYICHSLTHIIAYSHIMKPHVMMEGLKLLSNPLRLEYKQVRMFGGH